MSTGKWFPGLEREMIMTTVTNASNNLTYTLACAIAQLEIDSENGMICDSVEVIGESDSFAEVKIKNLLEDALAEIKELSKLKVAKKDVSNVSVNWLNPCDKCSKQKATVETEGDHLYLHNCDKVTCSCGHTGSVDVIDGVAVCNWGE
jgi:hypothetical protein